MPEVKLGLVVHVCNPSYTGDTSRRIAVGGQPPGKNTRLNLKNKRKRAGGMVKVVRCLPSKCKALI
jgi:hypothetical protein